VLKFNGAWRFNSPGKIAEGVHDDFFNLVGKIVGQGPRQRLLEHFKGYFASAAGSTSSWSSSESWASTDLHRYMSDAAENAPLFIEAFYDACKSLANSNADLVVPDFEMINQILSRHNAGFEIQPPELLSRNPAAAITVQEQQLLSLDEQAQDTIQKSLKHSEQFLSSGQYRQAVQEILWLLESVSTLFRGLTIGSATVEGKYFNKIADDLRKNQRGTTFEQVLNWATTLHGYLSSPTGGGVRHGAALKAGIAMNETEARLYCNLIRSYISFLLAEHERLRG
jgi:hypothetical protein